MRQNQLIYTYLNFNFDYSLSKIYSSLTPLVLALFSHLFTCLRRNCLMMLYIFDKIFDSNQYLPTSEIFLMTLFGCIYWLNSVLNNPSGL